MPNLENYFSHLSIPKERYYIHRRKNKNGTACYYLSTKTEGNLVKKLPKGFEIYNHPETNQPFIRRIRPKIITDEEKELVEALMRKHCVEHFRVDIRGNFIVIYISHAKQMLEELSECLGIKGQDREVVDEEFEKYIRYSAVLRLSLEDKKKRTFSVARASINGWMDLYDTKSLKTICKKYFPHIGKESFYELV